MCKSGEQLERLTKERMIVSLSFAVIGCVKGGDLSSGLYLHCDKSTLAYFFLWISGRSLTEFANKWRNPDSSSLDICIILSLDRSPSNPHPPSPKV
jgi:hypothetical protein